MSGGQSGNDADQVAFRVLEPSSLASTRHPSDAALGSRLWGVVLLELDAATPHLLDRSAHVGHLDDGLREFPRRPGLSGIDEESVDTVSNRYAHAPIARLEKAGLDCVESHFLEASDGRVGLTVGDGVNQLFVYPARARSSGEFTQAVIHVADVGAAVGEMRGRGVEFEDYDTQETRTQNGIARTPDGGEAAWFKDTEGNLVGIVRALTG